MLDGRQYERHVTESELRARHALLQERVTQLEAAQELLRQTRQQLLHVERLRAMGQMAAAIVSQVDGPLATIERQAGELLAGDSSPATRSGLEEVQTAVGRLRELTQDALRFSRGGVPAVRSADLELLVGQVHRFFRPLARRVDLKLALAGDLPPVRVDPSHAEQVMANFVMNALDALEGRREPRICLSTGSASLDVLLQLEEEAGWPTRLVPDPPAVDLARAWIWAEVRDNGPGIPAEHLGLLFEPFFTTKGVGRGTGLGLSISRALAEECGGAVLVASRSGAGASFRLLLQSATPRVAGPDG
jgi:C4-dicarboxylate-specific signal transduction histidine kinase